MKLCKGLKIETFSFSNGVSLKTSDINLTGDGVFIDSTDAGNVIQEMNAFNTNEGISAAITGDTNTNQDTMTLVAGSWQG